MKPVGFDQKISIEHLDKALEELSKISSKEIYSVLDSKLYADINGAKSRKNAITMIMKIWKLVNPEIEPIRDSLLQQLTYMTDKEKKAIHWCMTSMAYPFFMDQVNHIGKHFRLADEVRSRVIINEMKNLYGDRRRVEVATGAVFSTIKNWGLINSSSPGVYKSSENLIDIENAEIKILMVETLMNYLETDSITLELVNNSAMFFPFNYHIGTGDLNNKRYTIFKNIQDAIIERNPKIPCSM